MISLWQTYKAIVLDLKFYGGVTIGKAAIVFLFNASFRLLLNYRIGRYVQKFNNPVAKIVLHYLRYKQIVKRGCAVSYKASLGNNIGFGHPLGIVIGDGVIIGDNVKLWQHVTIGSHGKNDTAMYPIIHTGARIYAGAKIIGGIVIGENSKIGANAVVNVDVPKNAVAVGIPAKIIQK